MTYGCKHDYKVGGDEAVMLMLLYQHDDEK